MRKIPTMFERDWNDRSRRVIDKIHVGCEWVADGEGIATRKIDGTCCLVRDGKLYKRRELRGIDKTPEGFEYVTHDDETSKIIGWVPCIPGASEDQWHREAFSAGNFANGTYELIGPKIQGNPERFSQHALVPHEFAGKFIDVPRTFDGLREWMDGRDIEGIVFHHPDGRMAKIKLKDFGMKRGSK